MGDETCCLLSQLVLPSAASFYVGSGDAVPASRERLAISCDVPVFLRYADVAIAVRFLVARTTQNTPAPIEFVHDGAQWQAMRLTCTHAATRPEGTGTIALWVRAAEELDDAAFERFRQTFCAADCEATVDAGVVSVSVAADGDRLRLVADVANERRIAAEGGEPNLDSALLAVNGRDIGRELLGSLEPVRRRQRWLTLGENPAEKAWPVNAVVEAEEAAMILKPFVKGNDADASGGAFVWMPGEDNADGGSRMARAAWVLDVPAAGDYALWARVKAPTRKDDSFYVRVRQDAEVPLELTDWHTGCHATWEWACATAKEAIALRKGRAVVEFHCREDGTRLDALFLGSDGKQPVQR